MTIKFLFKMNNYKNNKNLLFKYNFHENIKIKFLFEIIKSSKYLKIKIISLLLRISIKIYKWMLFKIKIHIIYYYFK